VNTLFWLSFACLESSIPELQSLGVQTLQKVMSETEFFKIIMMSTAISDNFYSYSLTLGKKANSLLPMVFRVLHEEDAYKILLLSIKVQDPRLVYHHKSDFYKMELQRLLLIIPYV